jgi:hypothetical protein
MQRGTLRQDLGKPDLADILLENNRLLKANTEVLLRIEDKLRKIAFNTNC